VPWSYLSSMVVFKIEVKDCIPVNLKHQTLVAGNGNTPVPVPVSCQRMQAPTGHRLQPGQIIGKGQRRQDIAYLGNHRRCQTAGVILFKKALKPFMANAPKPHLSIVRSYRTDCGDQHNNRQKMLRKRSISPIFVI